MKKTALIIAFFAISVATFGEVVLGLKAGYNTSLGFDKNWNFDASNITGNFKSDVGHGFNVGLFARIGKRWFAQPEIYYNMQRSNYKLEPTLESIRKIDQAITMSTFDVPVMAGFNIVNGENVKFRIMAGPQFRFNAGSVLGKTKKNQIPETEQDVSISAKKTQLGLAAGLGLDLWCVTLDVRYNLIDQLYTTIVDNNIINNNPINAFNVSLGWKFLDLGTSKKKAEKKEK